jgi:hypothetical protein
MDVTAGTIHHRPLEIFQRIAAQRECTAFRFRSGRRRSRVDSIGDVPQSSAECELAMSTLVSTVMMATLVVGPFYLSGALGLGAALHCIRELPTSDNQ